MIRIALVDDHQIIIDGLKSLLSQSSAITVSLTANSAKEILEKLQTNSIDILVTDITMPQISGLELAKIVKQQFPEIKIIALSMNADGSTIDAMVNDADIAGYLLKQTGANELIAAIEKIYNGGIYFQTEILNALEKQSAIKKNTAQANLSARELQIVALMEKDFSNKQIATELDISVRTVETHRKNIFRKTNTNNLLSLIKWAYANKVLKQ